MNNRKIEKDVTRYKSQDGYAEYEFGEITAVYNPAPFAGLRLEQTDYDKNGKPIKRKISISHTQAKTLKKIIRDFYPKD